MDKGSGKGMIQETNNDTSTIGEAIKLSSGQSYYKPWCNRKDSNFQLNWTHKSLYS